MVASAWLWISTHIVDPVRQIRLSYLPPLLVYMAAGISGLTGIVGTFFVKDTLGLSAEFLATLGFWIGLPWALKMPLGHLVDLIWRWKSAGVVLDDRTIRLTHTTMQTLGRMAMTPMLARIANSAPPHLKATFLAVMASFSNLALSLSNLGTKYLNQIFTVSREILGQQSGAVTIPAD